jgi:hypothetical protein
MIVVAAGFALWSRLRPIVVDHATIESADSR